MVCAACGSGGDPAGDIARKPASQGAPPASSTASGAKRPIASLPPNIQRALRYLEALPDLAPSALLVIDPLRRWFGLDVFPDLLARYRFAISRGNDRRLPLDRQASYLRVMLRVIEPRRINTGGLDRWEDFAPAMLDKGGINVITIPALYCDQLRYPDAYESILEEGVRSGGYDLTHVGMALRWIDEVGCSSPMDPSFEATVASAIAELTDPADGVSDLEIEATAFLMYMGRRDLVSAAMTAAIANVQRPDGGWSRDSSDPSQGSHWHPTVLALWVLLGQYEPDVDMSPIVVPGGARPR